MALLLPKRRSNEETIQKTSSKKIKLCTQNNGVLKESKHKKMSLEDLLMRIIVALPPLNQTFKTEKRRIEDAKKKENDQMQMKKESVSPIHILENSSISSTDAKERRIVVDKKENNQAHVRKEPVFPIHVSENCNVSSTDTEKRLMPVKENISSDSTNNQNLFIEGNLVWAKLTMKESYWPAIVLKKETTGFSWCDENQCCVFWLRDNRLSKVPKKYIVDYASFVPKLTIKKNENVMRTEAIYESIDLYAEREYEVILTLPNNEKLPWLKQVIADPDFIKNICKKRFDVQNKTSQDTIHGENKNINQHFKLIDQNNKKNNLSIPDHMWAFIRKIKSRNEEKDKEDSDVERKKDPYNFCLVCTNFTENVHPLFNFKLCKNCTATYLDNFFEFDVRKQKKRFCVICGIKNSEKYSNEGYIWVFCSSCIENYFQLPANEITENWKCFLNKKCLCSTKKTKHNGGLLEVQRSWWNNLSQSYMEIKAELQLYPEFSKVIYVIPGSKNGTININKFPIDMRAATKNYIDIYWKNKKISNEIKQILSSVQENMVILLVGSAGDISEPWIDWDKNQNVPVKNLEHLFMEFYHIYCKVNELSLKKQIKMQWIFECSAEIPAFTRKRNTRFLNVSPKIINIQKKKGDNGFRMIWTNIDETEYFFKKILNV